MNNTVARLVSLLSAPHLVNEVALRNKLTKLINAVTNNREPKRVLRLSRRLCERCIKDTLTAIRNVRDIHIWQLLKDHGCVYLPNGNQDRVLLALIREFSSQPRPQLSRPMVIERVLGQLQLDRTQTNGSQRFSKTNVGHVLQLLFRSGAFEISHEEGRLGTTTVWRLREELLDFEQLRRVHDTAIVAMAQQEGIFLSPSEWSRCLYRDWRKAAHFQSILDRQRVELDALVSHLRKTNTVTSVRDDVLDTLSRVAGIPNVREYEPSGEEVQYALLAVQHVFEILIEAQSTRQDATRHDWSAAPGGSRPASVNTGLFSMATYMASSEDAGRGRMRSASTCAASPSVACSSPMDARFTPLLADSNLWPRPNMDDCVPRAVASRLPFALQLDSPWPSQFARLRAQTDSHFVPILSADERASTRDSPRFDTVPSPLLACQPFAVGSPLQSGQRPILGRGAAPLSTASSTDELQQLVADFLAPISQTSPLASNYMAAETNLSRASATPGQSQAFASPLSSEPDSFCFRSFVSSMPSAANSPELANGDTMQLTLRRTRRSSSACDVSSNGEFDECMHDLFPGAAAASPPGVSPGVSVPFAALHNLPSPSARHAPSAPLFLRTLSENAKDDLLS